MFGLFGLIAVGAAAVGAPSAMAAPKARRAPTAIELVNSRAVTLTGFELASADSSARPVAALKKPLPAGKKIRLALRGAKGCDYVARWKFEDAGDEAQVDLCNDPKVVLTD